MKTPAHIVPEWYFLPFYAILRAITFNIGPIDSKLGGVLAMFGAIAVLFFVPWLDTSKVRSAVYRPWYRLFFWPFAINAVFLGWLGSKPAEGRYILAMQMSTLYYFAFFLVIMPMLGLIETPRRMPNSITEAAPEKNKGGSGHPVARRLRRAPKADRTGRRGTVHMKRVLHGLAAFSFLMVSASCVAYAQESTDQNAQPAAGEAPAAEQPAPVTNPDKPTSGEGHEPAGADHAAEGGHSEAEPTHFPIRQPKEESWSFAGPFGTYDKAQLQRGLKVYKEVCSACHSMHLVPFRTLGELGYSEAQVKALAAEYTI